MTSPSATFSDEDYHKLILYRKAGIRTTGTPEELLFDMLTRRYYAAHPLTPERLAWHEAGHAVVAHRLGYRVVEIRRLEPLHWDTGTFPPLPYSDHSHLITVAGYLAEGCAMGRVDPGEAWRVAVESEQRYGYGPEERRAYVEEVEGRALRILDEHWAAVAQVAALARLLDQDREIIANDELDRALSDVRFGDG